MFSIIAFSESLDPAGVFVNLAAVPDQHIRIEGDFAYIPQYNRLLGALACLGTTGAQCRITTPSLRGQNPYHVCPVDNALNPDGAHIISVDKNSEIALLEGEGMEVEENSNPAAAEQHTVVIWLSDGIITPVKGNIITLRFTITLAQLAGEWAYSAITLIDELPLGNWIIVGARVEMSGGIAARFVSPGVLNRPGVPCHADAYQIGSDMFRKGGMGEFLNFETNNPPAMEVISSAAVGSATYQCYMDVIKV